MCLAKASCTCCLHRASAANRSNKHQTQTVSISTRALLPDTLCWRWSWGQVLHITNPKKFLISLTLDFFPSVSIAGFRNYFKCRLLICNLTSPSHIVPPISSDHGASPLSELTSAEHIVAISLAWCVISVLSCCWGCCPVRCRVVGWGGHMHEGGRCRHLSPRFCHSPRSFDGSLRCPVTPPGWKQLVTRASAMLVNMEGCMVRAGVLSGTGSSLCVIPDY